MRDDELPWPVEAGSLETLEQHVRGFFKGHSIDEVSFDIGPIHERLLPFTILRVGPGPRIGLWVYCTLGASAARSDDHGWEFMVIAPEQDEQHHETLTMTAFYHAGPEHQRLGLGHTVPIGKPWVKGSSCDHLLVSLPYTFGPDLEKCTLPDGHAQILWLLPITETERRFKAEHGLDALEDIFEDNGIEYWNPLRRTLT